MDYIEAAAILEDEFNVEISDDDAEKFLTTGDAVEYLHIRFGEWPHAETLSRLLIRF